MTIESGGNMPHKPMSEMNELEKSAYKKELKKQKGATTKGQTVSLSKGKSTVSSSSNTSSPAPAAPTQQRPVTLPEQPKPVAPPPPMAPAAPPHQIQTTTGSKPQTPAGPPAAPPPPPPPPQGSVHQQAHRSPVPQPISAKPPVSTSLNDVLLARFKKNGVALKKGGGITLDQIEAETNRKMEEARKKENKIIKPERTNTAQSSTSSEKQNNSGSSHSKPSSPGKAVAAVTNWMEANEIKDMTVDKFLQETYWGCTESFLINELKTLVFSDEDRFEDLNQEFFLFAKDAYKKATKRTPQWQTLKNFRQENNTLFDKQLVVTNFIDQIVKRLSNSMPEDKVGHKEALCSLIREKYGIQKSASEYILRNEMLINKAFDEQGVTREERNQVVVNTEAQYLEIMKGALSKEYLEQMKNEAATGRVVDMLRKDGKEDLAKQLQEWFSSKSFS